jgi:hypothetical protein
MFSTIEGNNFMISTIEGNNSMFRTIEGNNSMGLLLEPLLKKVTSIVGSRMLCVPWVASHGSKS